jgi:hypothetical protein
MNQRISGPSINEPARRQKKLPALARREPESIYVLNRVLNWANQFGMNILCDYAGEHFF